MAAGALGFGSGLAKGLATGLLRKQEQKREDARRAEDQEWKQFQMLEPIVRQQAVETGDWGAYSAWIGKQNKDLGNMFKKEGGSLFENLAPILAAKPPQQAQAPPDASLPTTPSPELDRTMTALGSGQWVDVDKLGVLSQLTPPPIPDRGPAVGTFVPEKPFWTFGGGRLDTPEAKQKREISGAVAATTATEGAKLGAQSQAKLDLAARLRAADPTMSIADSFSRVGLDLPGRSSTPPQLGSFGDEVARREVAMKRPMTQDELRQFRLEYDRQTTQAGMTFGVDREALAPLLFGGRSYGQLNPEQQAVTMAAEQDLLKKEGAARTEGAGIGRLQAPIDIPTSQSTGQPVGTKGVEISGQTVPPLPLAQRRRSMEVLRQDLERAATLIGVLPSEDDPEGFAPGATLGLRRRMNAASGLKDKEGNLLKDDKGKPLSYRSAVAALESVVDGMVNVLARAKAESIGTQTEQDATRAYNAVVQLRTGLTNPLGGDTRESALARISETMAGIDRVIAGLPATPIPGARGQAAPTAQPNQGVQPPVLTQKDGNFYINGVEVK
jgi:hypothetical protein